tara:strand:- start:1179 stop:1424 length:246 start_codon:yes stop_codon:yes gene_type:complete
MPKKDSQMNPNGARLADKPGEQNVAVDSGKDRVRCIPQSVQTVAKKRLCPSGLAETVLCTAVTVLAHDDRARELAGKVIGS